MAEPTLSPDVSATRSPAPQLRKKLGLFEATSINMSNMIGIGPFITVPLILSTMGGPQALISWFVGAVFAIADGLVVAELGAALPDSGGSYVFLRDSFGRRQWGRLLGWMFIWQFLFSGTLEIASGAIGMTQYLSFIWPGLGQHLWGMKFVAAGVSVIVMLALYQKINDVARLMTVLWITTLLTTVWVIVTGLAHFNPHLAFAFSAGAFKLNWAFLIGLGNGTVLVLYNYSGYYQICYLGGEVRAPERTIPVSVILSILGVAAIDFLLSLSFISAVPWREMVTDGTLANRAVATVLMSKVYGYWGALVVTVMILFTAFASVYALMMGYSRIPYAAALDGAFFRWFGVLHRTKEFPHRSLMLVGGLSMVASFFDLGTVITGLLVARILVQSVGQIFGLFILRRRGDVALPFKMWLYPVPAVVALAGWIFMFCSAVLQPGGWRYMLYASGTLVTGLAAYFLIARSGARVNG